MHHFVQYHNPDKRGQYRRDTGFGIVTNKSVDSLPGNRVWLITREGRSYRLVETFIVEKVGRKEGRQFSNYAKAHSGQHFDPPVPIESETWFRDLFRIAGNFGFGLTKIEDQGIIAGLVQILSRTSEEPPSEEKLPVMPTASAGFGDSEQNKRVERAAVDAVTEYYRARGWTVQSMEKENPGYDLLCTHDSAEQYLLNKAGAIA
jgi:hypothetical protein